MSSKLTRSECRDLCRQKNRFWRTDKVLAKQFGLLAASFFAYLNDLDTHLAPSNGWFFRTREMIYEDTGVSNKQAGRLIKELVDGGVLKIRRRGVPARQYFWIDYEQVLQVIRQISPSVRPKGHNQFGQKGRTN